MERITLGHGSGGKLMHKLIDTLFMKELSNDILARKRDSAILNIGGKRIAFTTDSYVVDPIFFPGGDIGSLAVYGTANDLSVCGSRPRYISVAAIIEEGFEMKILEKVTISIARAAKRAGVTVVTGDTKVVEKGSCDKIYINTSGIGEVFYEGLSLNRIKPGDAVIVSGSIGEHAISVLSKREGLDFQTSVKSDSAPLNSIISKVLNVSGRVKFMRDPTRGGLATTLNEIVEGRSFGVMINEASIPVSRGVSDACELLGYDPMYLACEGRFVVIVEDSDLKKVLRVMRKDPCGRRSAVIGRVTGDHKGRVCVNTSSGGKRYADMLSGEQLPRIC